MRVIKKKIFQMKMASKLSHPKYNGIKPKDKRTMIKIGYELKELMELIQ